MEGFIINLIATVGFSGIFLMVFFLVYYLYLKGAEEGVMEEDKGGLKRGDMYKRVGKGF